MNSLSIEEIEGLKSRAEELEKILKVLIIYSEMARKNTEGSLCRIMQDHINKAKTLVGQKI